MASAYLLRLFPWLRQRGLATKSGVRTIDLVDTPELRAAAAQMARVRLAGDLDHEFKYKSYPSRYRYRATLPVDLPLPRIPAAADVAILQRPDRARIRARRAIDARGVVSRRLDDRPGNRIRRREGKHYGASAVGRFNSLVTRLYGPIGELREVADAFSSNVSDGALDVPGLMQDLLVNELIDRAYGARAGLLKSTIYSRKYYRLPVGYDAATGWYGTGPRFW